jgi:hypothetical protein
LISTMYVWAGGGGLERRGWREGEGIYNVRVQLMSTFKIPTVPVQYRFQPPPPHPCPCLFYKITNVPVF